jgi:hypothetical protein
MVIQSEHLSPRVNRALAELEFDLWQALIEGELEPDTDLKLDFKVKRQGIGTGPYEESVDVVIAIRKRPCH